MPASVDHKLLRRRRHFQGHIARELFLPTALKLITTSLFSQEGWTADLRKRGEVKHSSSNMCFSGAPRKKHSGGSQRKDKMRGPVRARPKDHSEGYVRALTFSLSLASLATVEP